MARYYFDTIDNGSRFEDVDGLDMESTSAARNAAVQGLMDLAAEALPGVAQREVTVEVLDDQRRVIMRADIRFSLDLASRSA